MAPLREIAGMTWTTLTPETAIISLLLFILLSVLLLFLCTSCGRHSFDLPKRVEDRHESLIRVVSLEDAMAGRENLVMDDIRRDERVIHPTPETNVPVTVSASVPEVQVSPGQDNGTWYQPWRIHTGVLPQQDGGTEYQLPNGTHNASERSPSPTFNNHISEVSSERPTHMLRSSVVPMDLFLQSAPPPAAFVDPPQMNIHSAAIPELQLMEEGLGLDGDQDQGLGASVTDLPQHVYDVIGVERRVAAPLREVILDDPPAEVDLVSPGYASVAKPGISSSQNQQQDLNPDLDTSTMEGFAFPLSSRSLVEEVEGSLSDRGWNPMYARVSRKATCPTPPPVPPPEDEEEEEEDLSPPLPDRSAEQD